MINRRFLNYKHYSSFLRDLNDEQISQDAIVFIQDESHPCIWTHGKEYMANTSTTSFENGTLTFGDGCGNTLFTITVDGGNLTITDSEGNQSTTSYVLNSDFQRTIREMSHSQLTESNFKTITTTKNGTVSILGEGNIDATEDPLIAGDGITIDNNVIKTTYAHVFLTQEAYDALESYDNNTLYFIYEESEEEPSGDAWGFDDTFPIILT